MKESNRTTSWSVGQRWFRGWMIFSMLILIGVLREGTVKAFAAAKVQVTDIDYEEETLTIKANSGDSTIFYSNKSQSTWEVVPGELDENNKITMDISFISKTSNYILALKGDKSTTPITVTLPKQNNKFSVSLDYTTNQLIMKNRGSATKVSWRKANTTKWHSIADGGDSVDFKKEIERYSLQGITLYFRLEQKAGTSATAVGTRPSKEATLRIPKRATKPSVSMNFSKETITLKTGMEYKNSESEEWIPVLRGKTVLSMQDLAADAFYSETNKEPKDVKIDVRMKATSSKAASQCNTITIPAQEQTRVDNIGMTYPRSTQLSIEIFKKDIKVGEKTITLEAASSSNPYEYTIVKENSTLSETAIWKSITSTIKVSKEDAPIGSKLYIRKKATDSALPTVPCEFAVNGYPSESSIITTELKKVSGQETVFTFPITVPYIDTTISNISFEGKEVTFTAKKAKLISETKMYSVDVTITSVANVEAVSSNLEKTLTAKITLNNGDTIEEGLTLYITPATKVETSKHYEKYLGLSFEDTISFVLDLNSENKEKDKVEVSTITYSNQNVNFVQSDCFNQEIEVTISGTQFDTIENKLTFAKLGTEIPFVITLTNGEVIKSGVTMKIKPIISMDSSTNGFGVSASTYKAALATETTADDLVNPVIIMTIDPGIYEKNDLIISSVSWNNKEIIGKYSNQGNVTTMTLSIANMIDGLDFNTKQSYSGYVVVTLNKKNEDDGDKGAEFKKITTSYKITVVK